MDKKADINIHSDSASALASRRDFVKGAASIIMAGTATLDVLATNTRQRIEEKQNVCFPVSEGKPQEAEQVLMPGYSITVKSGDVPRLAFKQNGQSVFEVPITSGLAKGCENEQLSMIAYSLTRESAEMYTLEATAKSSVWQKRRFVWRFLAGHVEFQQFASGRGKLGRCYFLSHGLSNVWDNGSSPGILWNTVIDADRYFSPAPNHANQTEFSIAIPQTLGFHIGRREESKDEFHPETISDLFAPPPLFLAFHSDGGWMGLGIGEHPGNYLFPGFEYWGSRYAGASFYVDYLGYRVVDGEFASPVMSLQFGWSALGTLEKYTAWMRQSGFGTVPAGHDAHWHHLPIFCGWAEQTVEAAPRGIKGSALSTQSNYESWIRELERRRLRAGTIVIDDKWQRSYGAFDIDEQKWPDMKGFVKRQHFKGRRVLLWIPMANAEGLPKSLCVQDKGRCIFADVGKPEYKTMVRQKLEYLVRDVDIDGFKIDWMRVPNAPDLQLTANTAGIEFARTFQEMIYSDTHKWKADAMVETQTPNVLFLNSSDVIRLNDVWCASRNVAEMMQNRAKIARISGWSLVDTDNASMTTLIEWWRYMQQQPQIGIPSLYFVSKTGTTHESPTEAQWDYLGTIWREYIDSLASKVNHS